MIPKILASPSTSGKPLNTLATTTNMRTTWHCLRCGWDVVGYLRACRCSLASICHLLVLLSPQLDRRVQPSKNVKPLALPRKPRSRPAEGTWCSTAGWGMTRQGGPQAKALQELDLRVLDTQTCNNSRFWNGVLIDSMLCLKAGTKSQAPCKVRRMACRPGLGSCPNQPLTPWRVEGGWD